MKLLTRVSYTGRPIEAARIAYKQDTYRSMSDNISQDAEDLKATRQLWQDAEGKSVQGKSAGRLSPANYLNASGDIDLTRYVKRPKAPSR